MLDFSSYRPVSLKEHEQLRQAERLFVAGYALQMAGDLANAETSYRESLRCHPTAEGHTFLGWSYALRGRLQAAIDECKKAILIDPSFGNPYNDIGSYLMQMGRPEGAEEWLRTALNAPRYECYHFAHANLARLLEDKLDFDGALEHYRTSVKLCPEFGAGRAGIRSLAGWMN